MDCVWEIFIKYFRTDSPKKLGWMDACTIFLLVMRLLILFDEKTQYCIMLRLNKQFFTVLVLLLLRFGRSLTTKCVS